MPSSSSSCCSTSLLHAFLPHPAPMRFLILIPPLLSFLAAILHPVLLLFILLFISFLHSSFPVLASSSLLHLLSLFHLLFFFLFFLFISSSVRSSLPLSLFLCFRFFFPPISSSPFLSLFVFLFFLMLFFLLLPFPFPLSFSNIGQRRPLFLYHYHLSKRTAQWDVQRSCTVVYLTVFPHYFLPNCPEN